LKEACREKILALIAIMAVLSAITGMIYGGLPGCLEGLSILVSLFVLVLIATFNDLRKDRSFVRLQELARDEDVNVLRGKVGQKQTLNIWDLVVGDVVVLTAGDKAPADCVIVESQNAVADQGSVTGFEQSGLERRAAKGATDPFLYADSYLLAGSVKAVVAAVGRHSTRGVKSEKLDTSTKSPLEGKLHNLSKTFTFIGIVAAGIILATSLIMLLLGTTFSDSDKKGAMFVKKLVEDLTLAVIIVVVSIPEGLPMTVAISLSYAVLDMFSRDKILVRDLTAPEQMGEITEILCGKTGTMTTEDMEVISCFAQGAPIKMFRKNTLLNCVFTSETVDMLKESIVWNSEAHIEIDENSFYVPKGRGTETSMIKWIQGAEIPVEKLMLAREGRVRGWETFNSVKRASMIAVEHPQIEQTIRVYRKGAPEAIFAGCGSQMGQRGKQQLDLAGVQGYVNESCRQGFRCIAFSFKDYSVQDFEAMGPFLENLDSVQADQTLIGVVAMKDPLRDRVKDVIGYARKGRVNVRMISGDNLETAKAMAFDAGILVNGPEGKEYDTTAPPEEQ
jgi:Ca2+-transporting ATPase